MIAEALELYGYTLLDPWLLLFAPVFVAIAAAHAEALGAGSTKREIAEKLGVKFSTINTLVTRIYRKLSVTRRAQLVNIIRNGG